MTEDIKPIFLFSLPRSGSTMAQRILAANPDIATASEPWILLPYIYTLKEKGSYSEYKYNIMRKAIKDFIEELPGGKEDYLMEIREFVLRLYSKAAKNDEKYFLDKTPRYHLIADEIIGMFPEEKFIFLWRNPLSVISSIIETSFNGKWKVFNSKIDLYYGLKNLIASYTKNRDRAIAVRYEDLITDSECQWNKIFNYLGLDFNHESLNSFTKVNLKGRMGDSTGVENYKSVSEKPLEKWKISLASPIRKAWCRRYLKWIGAERLSIMGYELDQLLYELNNIPVSYTKAVQDIIYTSYGICCTIFEPYIIKDKFHNLTRWKHIYTHK